MINETLRIDRTDNLNKSGFVQGSEAFAVVKRHNHSVLKPNEFSIYACRAPKAILWSSIIHIDIDIPKATCSSTGDIMVAVWFGTQADEAFASSWQSDTGGLSHFRSKQYATPRLWYLRVTVLEAENLIATDKGMSDPVGARETWSWVPARIVFWCKANWALEFRRR